MKMVVTKQVVDAVVEVNFLSENMHKFQFFLVVERSRYRLKAMMANGVDSGYMQFLLIVSCFTRGIELEKYSEATKLVPLGRILTLV